jgi:hypothetical protein
MREITVEFLSPACSLTFLFPNAGTWLLHMRHEDSQKKVKLEAIAHQEKPVRYRPW